VIQVRPFFEKTLHKNKAGGVAQGEDPEFKLEYHLDKKRMDRNGISSQKWNLFLISTC
jgi:hypothetical protein